KPYMTTAQRTIPTHHKAWAASRAPATMYALLPSTQVPATTVKKPGPLPWSQRSANTRRGKMTIRVTRMPLKIAYSPTFSQSSANAIARICDSSAATETMLVAITRAKYPGKKLSSPERIREPRVVKRRLSQPEEVAEQPHVEP